MRPVARSSTATSSQRKASSTSPRLAWSAAIPQAEMTFDDRAAMSSSRIRRASAVSPRLAARSPLVGGALLVAAGVYQLTPLKAACLAHCRSPLGFLLTEWREGVGGALRMGFGHGLYCLGCCALLMGLLFVTGVMNLLWVAVIAAFILVEKVAPGGPRVGWLASWALIGTGLVVLARALGGPA